LQFGAYQLNDGIICCLGGLPPLLSVRRRVPYRLGVGTMLLQYLPSLARAHGPTGAIVKTCGSRSLGSFGLGLFTGPLDEFAAGEGRSGADQGDQVGRVDGTPAVLG